MSRKTQHTKRLAKVPTEQGWDAAAQLQDDLSIAQDISQCTPDGSMGHGHSVSVPGNDDYESLRKLHKLEKPGDASTVFKRFIDGAWVVVEDQAK